MLKNHPRQVLWGILAVLVVLSVVYATTSMEGLAGYLQSWGGTLFRAMSGGFLGWLVSRYVMGLDLSEIPATHRATAALSQAIIIGAFVVGVASGA